MSQWVDLKVGFSCNNHCIHCVVSDKNSDENLSFEKIKVILQEYIDTYGTIQLTLTGGEVTIRRDFLQIMDYISDLKTAGKIEFVDMQTNARMLANNALVESTVGVVDFFLVALHSSQSDIHDAITRSPGSFIQTTHALQNISSKLGVDKIAIQTVINRKNYTGLKNICSFVFEQYGIKEFNITFPHPIGDCYSTEVVPSYQEVQPYVNEALEYCFSQEIFPYIEALPYCIFRKDFRQYAVDFYRRRGIHVVGYAGEQDGKLDYLELAPAGHAKYSFCKNCTFTTQCEGVWSEHVELYPYENLLALME